MWLLLNKIHIPEALEEDTGGLAEVPLYFSSISSVTLSALSDLSLSRRGSPLFTLPTAKWSYVNITLTLTRTFALNMNIKPDSIGAFTP